MRNYLSERVTDFLFLHGTIKKEEKDIYTYGVELIISSIINLLICLIISILFGDFVNGLIFFISFSSLRRFTGGFHSKSFLRCNMVFGIIVVITQLLNLMDFLNNRIVSIVIILLIFLIIVLFSPVYNDNKILTKQERKNFLFKSIVVYLSHIIIYYLTFKLVNYRLNIILITDSLVAVMIVWGIINNRFVHRKIV